jgi:nickel superoxide dismutase
MKKTLSGEILLTAAVLLIVVAALPQLAGAHCQIPCGIYDDHARVESMLEDAETVIKAARQISDLAGKTDPQSQNQLIRWVVNKEVHAQKVIATICDYFLTQRVKPEQEDYAERLQKHHAVILAAMKAKQHADVKFGEVLRAVIQALAPYYPEHTH